jgi:2-keto-3-deoxy-L-rhamnonate aldolase RhmA
VVTSNEVILLARAAGYDSVFIDLEHSTHSLETTSRLCSSALLAGVTPFVRVPAECGSGYVQRVLDGGALGIVFPHINTVGE